MRRNTGIRFSKSLIVGLAVSGAILASGCSPIRSHRGFIVDPLLVDSIAPGVDNRASVERTLGRPTFVGQFTPDEWYYVSRDTKQLAFANPRPSEQTVLRVRFDAAGNVVAVDKTGVELAERISPESDETVTRGNDRSLFEDIFGNIGTVGAPGAGTPPQ